MANIKELKNRIGSVQNTRKITNAMYLISSAKMRRAKEGLEKTRLYFESTEYEIKRIFQSSSDIDSVYFYPPEDEFLSNIRSPAPGWHQRLPGNLRQIYGRASMISRT